MYCMYSMCPQDEDEDGVHMPVSPPYSISHAVRMETMRITMNPQGIRNILLHYTAWST